MGARLAEGDFILAQIPKGALFNWSNYVVDQGAIVTGSTRTRESSPTTTSHSRSIAIAETETKPGPPAEAGQAARPQPV
jgi:hypothetical protein